MISVNLKCVKANYLNILKPSTGPLAFEITPRYSLLLIIPPTYAGQHLIRKAIGLEALELDTPVKSPLKHGDSDLDDCSIYAKHADQPTILNADGSVADIEQRVKGLVNGDYFDVTIAMYAYEHSNYRGVSCAITRIKFRNQ